MKSSLLICCSLLFFLSSCNFFSTSNSEGGEAKAGIVDTPKTIQNDPAPKTPLSSSTTEAREITTRNINYTCVPNERFGMIKKTFSEDKLNLLLGKSKIMRKEIGLGEGETTPGNVIFPGTKNSATIIWDEAQPYKKIARVRFEEQGAEWKTPEGIGIGTTLEELEKINGKAFKFAGFEWDYAGIAKNWEGGKISPFVTVFLAPTNEQAIFPDLLGDALFSSDHPKAKAAGLKVISMELNFD